MSARAAGSTFVALLTAVAPAFAASDPVGVEPALGQLASRIVERLAGEFPAPSGVVVKVVGTRALTDVTGVSVGDVLDAYGPEPESPEGVLSLSPLGKCKVVDASPRGTWVEPVPPMTLAALSPSVTLKARQGPQRVAVSCGPRTGTLERLAGGLEALMPDRLRQRGFLQVDSPLSPRGSLFAEREAAERAVQARDLDHLLHVIVAVRGGELCAYGELLTAGKRPRWDVFAVNVPGDDQVALLLEESPGDSRGLRALASVLLPSEPLALATVRVPGSASTPILVLTKDVLLRFRYRDRAFEQEGSVPLPASLPRAEAPSRNHAGVLESADLDRDGKPETYLAANWLRLPYRILPLLGSGAGGTLESIAEPVLGAAGGGFLTGSFMEGTDVLGPTLTYKPGSGQAPLRQDMPFPILRAVPWEGRHFLVLTIDGELAVLRPEGSEVAPLQPTRRTGYAFDVSYDAQNARTVLAATATVTQHDQVTLMSLLPPDQVMGRVDLTGAAEAVLLRDLDGDGKIELVVAEGQGSAHDGVSRLSVYPTDMVVAAPMAAPEDGKAP